MQTQVNIYTHSIVTPISLYVVLFATKFALITFSAYSMIVIGFDWFLD